MVPATFAGLKEHADDPDSDGGSPSRDRQALGTSPQSGLRDWRLALDIDLCFACTREYAEQVLRYAPLRPCQQPRLGDGVCLLLSRRLVQANGLCHLGLPGDPDRVRHYSQFKIRMVTHACRSKAHRTRSARHGYVVYHWSLVVSALVVQMEEESEEGQILPRR